MLCPLFNLASIRQRLFSYNYFLVLPQNKIYFGIGLFLKFFQILRSAKNMFYPCQASKVCFGKLAQVFFRSLSESSLHITVEQYTSSGRTHFFPIVLILSISFYLIWMLHISCSISFIRIVWLCNRSTSILNCLFLPKVK